MEEWVWIIAGTVAGLTVFSIAYTHMVQTNIATIDQRSLEEFEEVRNIINNLCWDFAGNKREYKLTLSENVEGIYAAKTPYEEYRREELIDRIKSFNYSYGNFFCIMITNKRLRCIELECNVSMPFVGSVPEKFSLTALINKLIGIVPTFDFYLIFTRTLDNVTVEYKG